MKKLSFLFVTFFSTTLFGQAKQEKDLSRFLPEASVLVEKFSGDLNRDGMEDVVLLIKGTDKSKIIKDEYRGELDRNRRGLIILFNKKGQYETVLKNDTCFSSENEDGGVYFPPELSLEIAKGNLYIHYGHGRYGHWSYTFRFRNAGFELIGYDASDSRGPILNRVTSLNFLTKKKQTKENTNENPDQESGDEMFKETWTTIKLEKLIELSTIADFDQLDVSY
jgi:hypothetical protein